jgi:hypothetical protein
MRAPVLIAGSRIETYLHGIVTSEFSACEGLHRTGSNAGTTPATFPVSGFSWNQGSISEYRHPPDTRAELGADEQAVLADPPQTGQVSGEFVRE